MRRVLFLIGSQKPKPSESTSASLANYLVRQLESRNCVTQTMFITSNSLKDNRVEEFLSTIDNADIIVLASPMYVDSLPYQVIAALEIIANHRNSLASRPDQVFMCVINGAIPGPHRFDTVLAICRKFCAEVGFEWIGGLALGGGEAIGGKPLDDLKFVARNVRKSLILTAEDIANGKPISQRAITLMEKPPIPVFIYRLIAELHFRKRAIQNNVYRNMGDSPYQ
ncbi:MAG: NAD(P)H-dependent oxidoreductase [Methylococcaceae bacterium]|nr:NAD(P)H-dependent oxidoreductase [Methylococcaceae bacterium]